VQIYDVRSHQLLRAISTHKGNRIAHVETLLRPSDLIGHVSIGGQQHDSIPVRPIAPFQRTRDAKTRETHEVTMLLPALNTVSEYCYLSNALITCTLFLSIILNP
jgi:pre-rRNA-processing protein IPI3